MKNMGRQDYLRIVSALVVHYDKASALTVEVSATRSGIVETLRKVLPKINNADAFHADVQRALEIFDEWNKAIEDNRVKVLASLAQNPEVVHSTIAD